MLSRSKSWLVKKWITFLDGLQDCQWFVKSFPHNCIINRYPKSKNSMVRGIKPKSQTARIPDYGNSWRTKYISKKTWATSELLHNFCYLFNKNFIHIRMYVHPQPWFRYIVKNSKHSNWLKFVTLDTLHATMQQGPELLIYFNTFVSQNLFLKTSLGRGRWKNS